MIQEKQTTPLKSAIVKHREFLFPAVANYYQEPIAIVRGEGEKVWDDQGNEYLDCFGGVLTVSIGHAEPRVNKAWIDQVNTIAHTSTLYVNGPQGDLAEKLAEISPGNLKKSFFSNSGSDAEDTLPYSEPPLSISPVRENLGGALLRDGQFVEAEKTFREDLRRNPGSGRSLFGLMTALEKQGKADEAQRVRKRCVEAWKYADIRLTVDVL